MDGGGFFFSDGMGDVLTKVGVFVLVQALVFLILSNSSDVFDGAAEKRSHSFRSSRSVSIRRILAALSDATPGGEPSPRSAPAMPPTRSEKQEHPRNKE